VSRWRDAVVAPFVAGLARVTAVADADGLLRDEEVSRRLAARGFTVLTYDDPIAFRLTYEIGWRDAWERGSDAELVVRVDGDALALESLPFDLLRDARRLVVDRRALFPDVPRRVLASMDGPGLDWLTTAPSREVLARYDARVSRLGKLLDALERSLPVGEVGHASWTECAGRWAEVQALRYEDASAPRLWHDRIEALHDRIEALFEAWMVRHFRELHTLSPAPPVMVHHVPRAMARALEGSGSGRVALLVLDGMAWDQWLTVRATLDPASWGATESTSGVFAWVPTTTVVSRQSLFAGRAPARFAAHLGGTSGEPALWRQFWRENGLRDEAVAYVRGLGVGSTEALDVLVADRRVRALGVVVDTIDTILHGAVLGTAGVHDQVRLWASSGWLGGALRRLLAEGFEVYVTSDHGNLELTGVGRVADGALADVRGERARVFSDDILRQKVARAHPTARCWGGEGLPDDYLCLLATGRGAFVDVGHRVVGHGGVALEEVIVPLVVFSPRE